VQKRVFVSGNFFALHAGHVRLLRFASELGDELVVGVSNLQPSPSFPTPRERAMMLVDLGLCDRSLVMEGGLETALRDEKPGLVVKGKEFEGTENPESTILSAWGGRLVFGSGEANYSGRDLLGVESRKGDAIDLTLFEEQCGFYNISKGDFKTLINRFEKRRVIVIGDTILDEYVTTAPVGLSREDPTIVVRPEHQQRYIGGAAIVAAHCAALGAEVSLYSMLGEDEASSYVCEQVKRFNVSFHPIFDQTRPTTTKRRYRCEGKTLLRVNQFRQHHLASNLQDKLYFESIADAHQADLVIFSDFSYGLLPAHLASRLIDHLKTKSCFLAADSQTSSQLGDLGKFRGVDYVTPTEHEARVLLNDYTSGIAVIGAKLRDEIGCSFAAVTLGQDGLLMFGHDRSAKLDLVDPYPAFNRMAKDTAGAGDSFLVASSLALSLGFEQLKMAALLGSFVSAIQVGRIGNLPVNQAEIFERLGV